MLINETKQKGFTLIELIAVLVVISILSAIAVPRYYSYKEDAKLAATKSILANVRSAINNFKMHQDVIGTEARFPGQTEIITPGVVMQEPIPENPYNGSSGVKHAPGTFVEGSPPVEGNFGWNYDVEVGRFWANTTEADANKL